MTEESSPPRSQLPRLMQVAVVLAAMVIVMFGLREVGEFVGPVFLALNLMLVAAPIFTMMTRAGIPRVIGAITAVVAVYAFLIVFLLSLWWSISVLVTEIPGYAAEFGTLWQQTLAALERIGISETLLLDQLSGIDPNQLVSLATEVASGVSSGVSIVAIVVTVLVFLSMDSITMSSRVQMIAVQHPRVAQCMRNFGSGVRRYWVVTTLFGAAVAVIDVVALWIIGVPFALVWGVLSFITNYIPNIGFILGLIPPTLVALLDRGVGPAIAVVIVYSVVNFILQAIIQPKYAGDAVGVTPTVSFLSLLVWSFIFGPTGALAALPATLLLKTFLVDADPKAHWFNAIISSRPDPALITGGVRTAADFNAQPDAEPPDAEPPDAEPPDEEPPDEELPGLGVDHDRAKDADG